MLATPLRPFLKEQIIPRPQESMGIFGRLPKVMLVPKLKKQNKTKKQEPRFLMNSQFFPDLTISFQWGKNRCTFELQILTGNSNQVSF